MKILFITIAFAPNEFSESIVNSKLVYALKKNGHEVDVICRGAIGNNYSTDWNEPWLTLKQNTNVINYSVGSRFMRFIDTLVCFCHTKYPLEGVRWIRRAYIKAEELIQKTKYDIIMTRSPSDVPHIVGLLLKKKHDIFWIANWNDPTIGIWPKPYENDLTFWTKKISMHFSKIIFSKTDINTFPSTNLYEHFKKYYKISNSRVKIIPHIMFSDLENMKNLKITDNLHICHSGNLSIEREADNLFKAISKFNNTNKRKIYLDILGISTSYSAELVLKYDLTDFVKFLSPLSYFRALKKMAEYDVLMIIEAKMPISIFLPSKIADYVQLEKPIISLSPINSELADLFNTFKGGLLANNQSVDDIYQKLSILDNMKNTDKFESFIAESKLKTYLSENNILDLYNQIFNNRYL